MSSQQACDLTFEQLAKMIDHSLLHPTLTDAELRQGCELAARYRVATVCIKPAAVPTAIQVLSGKGVGVGTVAGFPHGSEPIDVKLNQIEWAAKAGAAEIDVVLNVGKVLSHDWHYVETEAHRLCEHAHRHGLVIKLIFETDFLTNDEQKIMLCRICSEAGTDFVKTSTGFGFVPAQDGHYFYQGATEHDVALMRAHCPPNVQIKAAGGIRTLERLLRLYRLGATRFGMTATARVLEEFQRTANSEKRAT